jgi:hypothetical protein
MFLIIGHTAVFVAQVLDRPQVRTDGRSEGTARALHVCVYQFVYEPDRIRSVQYTYQEDAGDPGETQCQFGVHRMHH